MYNKSHIIKMLTVDFLLITEINHFIIIHFKGAKSICEWIKATHTPSKFVFTGH